MFREHNVEADELFKESPSLHMGALVSDENIEGEKTFVGRIHAFK